MMSMFNWDGQIVADVLHAQQIGEFCNGLIRDRAAVTAADLQQELIAVHQQYGQVVARYNQLADRFNRVIDEKKRVDAAQTEAIADKDRRIAELAAENYKLAAEKEDSRQSASEGWAKHHDALVEIERLKLKCGELLPDERKPDADL